MLGRASGSPSRSSASTTGQFFNHFFTLAENSALPLRYHQNLAVAEGGTARAGDGWKPTGLAPWSDCTPGTVGRSWQKRAGLARALMLGPEVSPLGSAALLDAQHSNWWLNFLDHQAGGHQLLRGQPMMWSSPRTICVRGRGTRAGSRCYRTNGLPLLASAAQLERAADPAVTEIAGAGTGRRLTGAEDSGIVYTNAMTRKREQRIDGLLDCWMIVRTSINPPLH